MLYLLWKISRGEATLRKQVLAGPSRQKRPDPKGALGGWAGGAFRGWDKKLELLERSRRW